MKLIMVGNSKYSQMLKEYVEDEGDVDVVAYAVDQEYVTAYSTNDSPVISFEQLKQTYPIDEYKLVLGVGYTKLGDLRKKLYETCKEMGYSVHTYIHHTSVIDKSVELGEANVIFENVVIQKNVKIGVGNLFFSNAVIMHDSRIGSHSTFGACSVANGFVSVEDCCFIGANATIKDGIEIKSHSLIGAGAYANRSAENQMVVLPAKSFYRGADALRFSEKL